MHDRAQKHGHASENHAPDGFEVTFSTPVDPDTITSTDAWQIAQWTYEPTARYGGEKIDFHDLTVESIALAPDGRTTRLVIPNLKAGYCIHLRTDATSTTGDPMWSPEAWYTLHRVPER